MTTYPHFPLQSQEVYHFTSNTLDSLPLPRPGAIASRDLWRVLVFAAAARLAVHQAWAQLEGAPSGPTVLGHPGQPGSERDVLDGHLNDRLATLLPQGLGTRGRRVALDVVAWPYHGMVEEAQHDAVCRRTAQGGTPHLFPYATAYAVVRGRRDTLARGRVRAQQPMAQVLRTLRARLVTWGLRIQLLLLDRGFYRVRVIHDLLTGAWPFLRPAVKRGKTPTTPGGPPGP